MSRPHGHRPALVVATMLSLLVSVLALAGCSAGTVTQTDTAVSGAEGAVASAGPVAVRDLVIEPGPAAAVPAGGQAPLQGTFVNESSTPVRLVGASSPYAAAVRVEGTTSIPGASAVRVIGSTRPLPPGSLATGTMRVTLQGVSRTLRPGPTYAVTFTFAGAAGSMTVPAVVSGPDVVAR